MQPSHHECVVKMWSTYEIPKKGVHVLGAFTEKSRLNVFNVTLSGYFSRKVVLVMATQGERRWINPICILVANLSPTFSHLFLIKCSGEQEWLNIVTSEKIITNSLNKVVKKSILQTLDFSCTPSYLVIFLI